MLYEKEEDLQKKGPYVRWGLLNVDSSLARDIDQLLLRWDIYGDANPKVTLFKSLLKELIELPYIPKKAAVALSKKLNDLKIYKVY